MKTCVEFGVQGRFALFTDPLTRVGGEKCSYHVPTYEALKGIAKSIYWKPTFVWVIDRVRVMKRMRTQTQGAKPLVYGGGNSLATYTYLADVEYQVQAHFEWNTFRPDLAEDRNHVKHLSITERMIEKGGRQDIFLGNLMRSRAPSWTVTRHRDSTTRGHYRELASLTPFSVHPGRTGQRPPDGYARHGAPLQITGRPRPRPECPPWQQEARSEVLGLPPDVETQAMGDARQELGPQLVPRGRRDAGFHEQGRGAVVQGSHVLAVEGASSPALVAGHLGRAPLPRMLIDRVYARFSPRATDVLNGPAVPFVGSGNHEAFFRLTAWSASARVPVLHTGLAGVSNSTVQGYCERREQDARTRFASRILGVAARGSAHSSLSRPARSPTHDSSLDSLRQDCSWTGSATPLPLASTDIGRGCAIDETDARVMRMDERRMRRTAKGGRMRLVCLPVVLLLCLSGLGLVQSAGLAQASGVETADQQVLLTQEQANAQAFLYEASLGDHLFELGRAFNAPVLQLKVTALSDEMWDTLMCMLEAKTAYTGSAVDLPVIGEGTLELEYNLDGCSRATLRTPTPPWYVWLRVEPQDVPSQTAPDGEGGV